MIARYLVVGLAMICIGLTAGSLSALPGDAGLQKIVDQALDKSGYPAIGAAVILRGKLHALSVAGVRKQGDPTPVTVDDPFHIGSCTKAITATLIGKLVEEGRLRWDTTIRESLTEQAEEMDKGWRAVTIDQLLAHRAGLPAAQRPGDMTLNQMHQLPGDPRRQRRAWAEELLLSPPDVSAGSTYLYANAGYVLLGMITEQVLVEPWEKAVWSRVLKPLGMTRAGLGAMGKPGRVDAPWQHGWDAGNQRLVPVDPGPDSDNPRLMSPAGTIHLPLADWAKFIIAHLMSDVSPVLLQTETWRRLHTPQFGGDYAGGWLVCRRPWGGNRPVLTHAGSNTMNYAVTWLAPEKGFAVLVVTNCGHPQAESVLDGLVGQCIERFTGK